MGSHLSGPILITRMWFELAAYLVKNYKNSYKRNISQDRVRKFIDNNNNEKLSDMVYQREISTMDSHCTIHAAS